MAENAHKVVFTGKVGVGKTTLMQWVQCDKFVDVTKLTTSPDYHTKSHDVDKRTIKITWWDTAGVERFQSMTDSYYRYASAIVHVFSVDDKSSTFQLKKTEERVKGLYDADTNRKVLRMVIANKTDLDSEVDMDHVKNVISDMKLSTETPLFKVSAKNGGGVSDALQDIVDMVARNGRSFQSSSHPDDAGYADVGKLKEPKKQAWYRC